MLAKVCHQRAALFGSVCSCLLLLLALPNSAAAASATEPILASTDEAVQTPATCGRSLNLGLDYFLSTQLFANLTKVDLPAEIPLPLRTVKIVNLRLAGLDSVSRGCSLELSLAGEAKLRLRACARVARLRVSFILKAASFPVDFVQAVLTDTSVSAQAILHVVPGGLVQLEAFDVALGGIEVENAGFSGAIITRLMRMSSVKEKVRTAIVTQGGKRIEAELKKYPLPQ